MENKKKGNFKVFLKKTLKRGAIIIGYVIALNVAQQVQAFAADDPISIVNNLSNFIFGLIRAVGMIILGFGIVQVGMSLKSHDPTQRANGIMTLAGGVVITFAKEILNTIIVNLVDDKDAVEVNEINGTQSVVFEVKVAENDMGKIIGKQGRIAKSIRTVMKAVASKEHKKATVEFIG